MVVQYFEQLFTSETISFDKFSLPNLFLGLSENDYLWLCQQVDDIAIKEALFNIGAWKAP